MHGRTVAHIPIDDPALSILNLHHVIYPENIYVTDEVILGWAHDALVNAAVDDHVREHGVIADTHAGEQVYEMLVRANPRPTDVEEAKALLSDLGTHTFARL
jgi:hypothetical protein